MKIYVFCIIPKVGSGFIPENHRMCILVLTFLYSFNSKYSHAAKWSLISMGACACRAVRKLTCQCAACQHKSPKINSAAEKYELVRVPTDNLQVIS